jgi:hypothetical protein
VSFGTAFVWTGGFAFARIPEAGSFKFRRCDSRCGESNDTWKSAARYRESSVAAGSHRFFRKVMGALELHCVSCPQTKIRAAILPPGNAE